MASTTKLCKVCSTPSTQHCSRCIEGLDHDGEPSPTYYCSVTCQTSHWPDHKNECRRVNARKQLYRGAQLVQQAFYAVREASFDIHIPRFWKDGDTIHMYNQTNDDGPLYPFPYRYRMDEEDKNAVLAFKACGEAAAYMAKLVEKVLDGITHDKFPVTEPVIRMKPHANKIVSYMPHGQVDVNVYEHRVVRVTLKNGQKYTLDLSGAQFGQYRAAMPASEYTERYVAEVQTEESLGSWSVEWDGYARFRTGILFLFDYSGIWLSNEIAKAVNQSIETWEAATGKTVAVMLKQNKALFETDKRALLDVMSTAVRGWIAAWEAGGRHIPPAETRR